MGCIINIDASVFVVHDIVTMFGVTATISIGRVDYMCFFLGDLSFCTYVIVLFLIYAASFSDVALQKMSTLYNVQSHFAIFTL